MSTTTDLSKFGYKEMEELEDILKAKRLYGLPDDFEDDETTPMFNMNSGYVFLTNSDFQVCMLNGDRLESFYSCPICGHEGFKDEMGKANGHGYSDECAEYVKSILEVAA